MAGQRLKRRYTATPSRVEVNVRAIPILPQDGWRLWGLDQFPIVGTVPKDYLSYGDPHKEGIRGYIAKKGRTSNDARECVTEEVISKIGALLPLMMAKSRLVRLSKTDVRFMSQNFVVRNQQQLLHGIELVARYFEANPTEVESAFGLEDKKEERRLYTIDNILTILEALFAEDLVLLKEGFFKMLAFDAFVGAPDRHAMNWGVLSAIEANTAPAKFAPIFDTARGLFREYSDADLLRSEERQGRERFLRKYALGSFSNISTGQEARQTHFDLLKWILSNSEEQDCAAMCAVFQAVDMSNIEHMLQRYFRRTITQFRILFIRDLLSHRIQRIRNEIQQ